VPPCALLVLGRLPSGTWRPPASATRPPQRLPCSCCCLPATGVRHSTHSTSPPSASRAAVPGCRPQPPAHPALQALRQSGLPAQLSTVAPPASLPPFLARWSGLPARLGTVAPPASLPPCSARWRLPPWLHCSVLSAFMLGCSATSRAGVPRCRAPATLPFRPVAPPCSTGSTAPLAHVLCATVSACRALCLLLKFDLS
jgi:hypothetical protein